MTNPLYDQLFGRHAGQETPFLILSDARVITHAAFLAQTAQIAHVLTHAGLTAGDRLAAQIHKSPQALALYAACAQTGVVFLPLNTAYTAPELRYFIENSGARMVVCDGSAQDTLGPIAATLSASVETLNADGSGSLMTQAAAQPGVFPTVPRSADDLAAFLYTSGTTGRSKGAMLTQRNLLSNAETLAEYWKFTAEDVLLHALPIFHTHGLFVALNTALLAGADVRLMAAFDIDTVIDELPQSTLMMGVPTFYTRLLDDDRFTPELTQNMRLFISGSAPLLAETHQAFEARKGHRILERYGMTETNMITSNPYAGDRVAGTVGYALPGTEVKVTNPETGEALPMGEIGMIEVRGDNVFQGYWNMPEKTAEELRDNGFFLTGDLAIEAEDGRISIVGRAKDLIISGGYNIYPKEIEDRSEEHTSELQSPVPISYAVFCLKKKNITT